MIDLQQTILNSIDKVSFYYRRNFKEVKDKFSEKAVHDLRVSIRRFLAILNILHKDVSSGYIVLAREQLKKELKLYNPLRDNQVQILKIEKLLLPYPVLQPYMEYLEKKEIELLNDTKSKIIDQTESDIAEMVFFLKLQLKQKIPSLSLMPEKFFNIANDSYKLVLERSSLLDKNDLNSFHLLRLSFKKFRYTMEFLQPILNLPSTYFKRMKGFQDILGDIQDNRVLTENLNYWILNYDIANQSDYLMVIEHLIILRKSLFSRLFKRKRNLNMFWDENFFVSS